VGFRSGKVMYLALADLDGTLDYDFMIPPEIVLAVELFGMEEIESNWLIKTKILSRIYHCIRFTSNHEFVILLDHRLERLYRSIII